MWKIEENEFHEIALNRAESENRPNSWYSRVWHKWFTWNGHVNVMHN